MGLWTKPVLERTANLRSKGIEKKKQAASDEAWVSPFGSSPTLVEEHATGLRWCI